MQPEFFVVGRPVQCGAVLCCSVNRPACHFLGVNLISPTLFPRTLASLSGNRQFYFSECKVSMQPSSIRCVLVQHHAVLCFSPLLTLRYSLLASFLAGLAATSDRTHDRAGRECSTLRSIGLECLPGLGKTICFLPDHAAHR
jgi:hypothetical protein